MAADKRLQVAKGGVCMIVSVHIPKSAGSALREYLKTLLGPDRIALCYPDEDLVEPITSKTVLLHGHLPQLHPDLDPQRIEQVVGFIREPISRVVSHFRYWQHQPVTQASPPLHRHVAAGLSLTRFAAHPEQVDLQSRYMHPWRSLQPRLYCSDAGMLESETRRFMLEAFGEKCQVEARRENATPGTPDELTHTERTVIEQNTLSDGIAYRKALSTREAAIEHYKKGSA